MSRRPALRLQFLPNMRNFRFFALAAAFAVFAACAPKSAKISGTVNGAPESSIEVKELNINTYNVLDTLKTASDGSFAYKLEVSKDDPKFVYLFRGDRKIASLLVKAGDNIKVSTDTLGACSVSGSEDSQRLLEAEKSFADFASSMIRLNNAGDNAGMSKLFVSHYRDAVKFVLKEPASLANIPVLYESLNESSPVFGSVNDALIFRSVCDSLKAVYPNSRYVKALEKETARREQIMSLDGSLGTANSADFPDLVLPDINGTKVRLSEVNSKLILLHFWNSADPAEKMMNLEVLKPLYEKYHAAGFEIYAVSLETDKAAWGSSVLAQKLPWINLNDGLGAASPSVKLYNVTATPTSFLLGDGDIIGIAGESTLEREIQKHLK